MGKIGYNQGDIGWVQLNTGDATKAIEFYTEVFGWENRGEPMPGYLVFGKGEESLGGVTALEEGQDRPGWLPYVTVDDLDATLENAKAKGAKVIAGPDPLPDDSGRIAVVTDPTGGTVGIAQYT